ncbi:ABC transporter permease [Pseudolysinimonas sp.]|uniref:ABC transporter permease n=1 Tax=Pseudolysinimonas sp. TaxID=2680009 RepID=UPI003F81D77F
MSSTGGAEPIHSESPHVDTVEPGQQPNAKKEPDAPLGSTVIREIMSGSAVLTVLAIVLALVVAAVLIAATDSNVQAASAYFFARPGDTFLAIWNSVSGAYVSLFQGSIFNFARPTFVAQIKPLMDTLSFATPLIAAGLGVALAFRVGMFNIGGRGQILIGAAAAGWVAWSFPMPPVIAFLVATVAAIAGGALWGGLVGLLKARTGAHEVIVTIMLNYVAFYLVSYGLRTQGLLQAHGSNNPTSPADLPNATFPTLTQLITALGGPPTAFTVNFGFILSIAATVAVWYLFSRSSTGFRFRAVGENPNAARTAGIDVKWVYILAMLMAGGLVGLAGADQVLGSTTTGFNSGVDAGIGFSAITVALLGRSRPWGVFFSGLLFGALQAGGYTMQALQQIPIDIVDVIQSVIVLFIAAPPLVRAVFRLPRPGSAPRKARKPRATIAEGAAK